MRLSNSQLRAAASISIRCSAELLGCYLNLIDKLLVVLDYKLARFRKLVFESLDFHVEAKEYRILLVLYASRALPEMLHFLYQQRSLPVKLADVVFRLLQLLLEIIVFL